MTIQFKNKVTEDKFSEMLYAYTVNETLASLFVASVRDIFLAKVTDCNNQDFEVTMLDLVKAQRKAFTNIQIA